MDGASLPDLKGQGAGGRFKAVGFDLRAQEDARRLSWSGPATLAFKWQGPALPASGALQVRYAVDRKPGQSVTVSGDCEGCTSGVDLTSTFALAEGKGWREMEIPLRCLAAGPLDGLKITADGDFTLQLEEARVIRQSADEDCRGPF